jgi:hypothetical protein
VVVGWQEWLLGGISVLRASLILPRAAATCFLTDYDDEILKNCEKNIASNDHLISKGVTRVRKLDWTWSPGPFPEYLRGTTPFSVAF